MLPRLALVDPELTLGLPRAITASCGLDALTQLIEPYVSPRANRMTDLFCVDGMRRAAARLAASLEAREDLQARTDMAWASLLGGLALANAGLGAVHGFAAPLGGMFPAPHGAACAAVLSFAMEVNIRALRQRAPSAEALAAVRRGGADSDGRSARRARGRLPLGGGTVRRNGGPSPARLWRGGVRDPGAGGRRGPGGQHEGKPDRVDSRRAARDRRAGDLAAGSS